VPSCIYVIGPAASGAARLASQSIFPSVGSNATRLLWVVKERTIESFQGFFTVIGEKLASQIEFVCSDMRQAYLDVIREKGSQALHILDRFHVVAKMNKAFIAP
jgi:transposase